MTQEQNKKTPRQFQCRDYLWEIFEQMSAELECSTDYLINEAMRQYARSRNYGAKPATPAARPTLGPPATGSADIAPIPPIGTPPQVAPAQAAPAAPQPIPSLGTTPRAPAPAPRLGHPSTLPPPPVQPPPRPIPQATAAPGLPSLGAAATPPRVAPPSLGVSAAPPPLPPAPASPPRPYAGGPPPPAPAAPVPPPSLGRASVAPPPLPAGPQSAWAASVAEALPPLSVVFNGQKIPVQKEEFIIGRGSKSADLPIKDGNISRRHAAIVFQSGAFYMKDLGSTNGVEFQGRRIDQKQIDEGDIFQICDYELRFTYR